MNIVSPKQAYFYAYDNGIKFPPNWYITQNFKWNEVFKNENLSDGIPIFEVFENAQRLANLLQLLREKLGKKIVVHSWVRQIKHNKRIGSKAKLSAHINGLAVDFHIVGVTISQTRAYIIAMKLPVRIEADTKTWVHIDLSSYANKIGFFNA